ncbi:hypothetical protein [Devosia sp. SD17-2]|uniref:hypothetical protein n=1 Tax=Devosia sp. SD17-2 TaxID=2976459 RepID=UPI0023D8C58C|nr:hypothetical protein [Devosia sp. SD17-2]WEJ32251.1 hypothetical protein NYQ88_15290 [Devosia sp. SD17-2]
MTTQLNKESSVKTIDRVAVELGEDVDRLFEIAIEMEPENGTPGLEVPCASEGKRI